MKREPWLLLAGALLLAACDRSPFPGYTPINEGLYFKLHALGDAETVPADSDSVLLRIRMAERGRAPGSLFSTERWYGMQQLAAGMALEVFGRMHQGDSAGVIIRAGLVPWPIWGASPGSMNDSTWVDVELSIRETRTPEEARALARQRRFSRTARDEAAIIEHYLEGSSATWKEYLGIRYALDSTLSPGPLVRSGDLVTIAYTGTFLEDGRTFDDTHRSGQPLTFRLGDPGQVIKGLEVATHLLWKGGRGRFIVPSVMAFGEQGSSSGIVPPFTPVLYEVEVLDVAGPEAGTL